jgi:putative FmdB family regulatory protein
VVACFSLDIAEGGTHNPPAFVAFPRPGGVVVPMYEYECTKCGHRFEKIQKYSDPHIKTCPKCKGKVVRLLSAPAIQFKGTGWYITDYARKGQSGGDEKPSKSSEGKSSKEDSSSKENSSSKEDKSSKESKSAKEAKSSTDSKGSKSSKKKSSDD